MAQDMHILYVGKPAGNDCLNALQEVICAYHFPACETDDRDMKMICYDTCLQMYQQCSNMTLPYFSSVGNRLFTPLKFSRFYPSSVALP
jgi:hypothetical protein